MLNAHGDRLIETTGSHGADIAAQRLDELDRRALRALLDRPAVSVVEYGGGSGMQALRFALLGARVRMIDLLPPGEPLASASRWPGLRIEHRQCDLASLSAAELPDSIDIAFSQRSIHYLRASDARRLAALTASRMSAGARFFVSASGIDSELGDGYPARELTIDQRFDRLAKPMRCKHGIDAPLCLYRPTELSALMRSVGFEEIALWSSTFGNVKGDYRWPG